VDLEVEAGSGLRWALKVDWGAVDDASIVRKWCSGASA